MSERPVDHVCVGDRTVFRDEPGGRAQVVRVCQGVELVCLFQIFDSGSYITQNWWFVVSTRNEPVSTFDWVGNNCEYGHLPTTPVRVQ